MALRWHGVLGCLCILLALTHSAVVPTENTLVVVKSDNANSEVTTVPEPTVTTEGPLPPVKLLEMQVKSEVTLRYSHTAVTTLVKNSANKPQETTFRVLLPETAFISGFSMTLQGKIYDAYVKEKEEAKQIYDDAVSQGFGAAHVAAKARDSNHFTVSVNVEANSLAFFNLTYEELLVRHNGVYNHAVNLHPGSPVGNLTVVVHIKEAEKITTLRVPEISTGNEIVPTEEDSQNTKAVTSRSLDEREATVVFQPDLEEQRRLMETYAQKTKESLANSLSYDRYSPEEDQNKNEGVLGQFVVQYDVDRSKGNEVLVNDGYFVHFFAPTDLAPLPKHVVFVLDTSGSMSGRKIEQLQQAMRIILTDLHPSDYFSIVQFESIVTILNLEDADKDEPTEAPQFHYYNDLPTFQPTILIPPYPATPENKDKAKVLINRLRADGGTNISGAFDVALDMVHRGVGWKQTQTEELTSIPTVTNTTSTNKQDVQQNEKGDTNLEPMIIFLTDGQATAGETDPKRIINLVSEKNYGTRKALIYTLAFGEGADRDLLRKLSVRNDGFMRHIYEASDASLQMHDFYQQVTSPLLAHVNFTYPPDQVKEDSLTKQNFRIYYAGSEIVVAGCIQPSATEFSPFVHWFENGQYDPGFAPKSYRIPSILIPKPVIPKIEPTKKEYLPLERLWAYLTIKQLLDERDAAEDLDKPKEERNAPEKKALGLALKYSFVTELTSLVVVKPNATKAVNAESVDQSVSNSFGVQSSAQYFASPPMIASLPGRPGSPGLPAAYYLVPQAYQHQGLSGIALTTRLPPRLVATTEVPSPLAAYHLEHYLWTLPLLDASADELIIPVNGTDVHLKLFKDITVSSVKPGDTCGPAIDGAIGTCVYLTSCAAAQDISADLYSSTYCRINNRFAGVCCPLESRKTPDEEKQI